MELRKTLKLVHQILEDHDIHHILIGGLALVCHGSTRSTVDLDLLVLEEKKAQLKTLLEKTGFKIINETQEIIQFSGLGYVDILLARRPLSQKMLKAHHDNGPEGIPFAKAEDLIGLKIQAYKNDPSREHQDKADIQFLIENTEKLDWEKVKSYADLFDEWKVLNEIKKKIKL